MQKILNEKKKAFRALDYFEFLNEDQLSHACKICSLRQFNPLDTIYSRDEGTLTNVHFVLSGECVILQCLHIRVVQKNGKTVHELVDTSENEFLHTKSDLSTNKKTVKSSESEDVISKNESEASDNYESHFIDVGSITFGGIFGLGEHIQHRVIMARNTVQCLLLPRFFLMDKEQNPGNIWQRRSVYLDVIIPSREALFDDFLRNLKWKKFKNDFVKNNVLSNSTDIARHDDIPILCRIEENR
ncbi:uncharacterized protein LOC6563546 [Drosophila grimshawi]|uniref:uncharacterized protein LOC6563546 n=1 Tax=Drosophila grimshawi TaxID=7222 RepID=UPI000C86E8A5|nr:uncharacterized protein LOC6563546 [Drosophila grimshawi]